MKKISFQVDDQTYRLIQTIAKVKDTSMSSLLRNIITKEIRDKAYQMGILNTHEINNYVNK